QGGAAPAAAPANLHYLSGSWFVPELVEEFDRFAKAWAAENNVNFTIDVDSQGSREKLAVAIEAGEGANLAQIDFSPTTIQDAVVDVTDIANALIEEQGEFSPATTYQCTIENRWYAIPFGEHPRMINYREDWFQEIGYDSFPSTWDETLEAGRQLKEQGRPYGWTLSEQSPADGPAACLALLWSFGGKEWNEDGSLALDSQETLDALNFAIQLYNDACDPASTSYQEATNNQAFLAGQISMTYNVNTIYLPAVDSNPELAQAMNHAVPPEGPGGRYGYTGVAEMILLNHTQGADLDAAQKFMSDFFSLEHYPDFIKLGQGYLIAATPGLAELPIWPEDPKLAAVRDMGPVGRLYGYALPFPNALASAVQTQVIIPKMFSAACSSGNAEEALQAALTEIANIESQLG
ncbi:MAG TPA: extracellular solute-binding protein, partial [Caldilineaceae bacterium]|nr:extracellular solute-binding protein [Caldilineaceae bacterium]